MPVHDWTQVEAGIFHALHVAWVPEISRALNAGLLPRGYYALAEQHAGDAIADVLALHASPADPPEPLPPLPSTGGTLVAEAPPKARVRQTIEPLGIARRRSLAIRHVSHHRLVALIEIASPANKDRAAHVAAFADKVASALESGVHVLLVDLFPAGGREPAGLHGAIMQRLARADDPPDAPDDRPPADEPLTSAAYAAGRPFVDAYVEYFAVGAELPEMPLFLNPDRYVKVPLEQTYQAAYGGMPRYWRDVLEGRPPEGF